MKWRFLCLFLALAGSVGIASASTAVKSNYEIVNTGIKGGGCWYDDSHFIVVKGQQRAPGQDFEVEGLYYLDPTKPKDLKRIDLASLEPSQQKHLRDVTCQEETLLFHILTADRTSNQLYTLKLGQPPVLLAERSKSFVVPRIVNVKNQYVLSFSRALKERGVEHSTTPEAAQADCPFSYLRPPYRIVCLRHDRGTKQTWLVDNRWLTKYIWDETIRVGQEGAYKWVPNPDPPLKLADGTELKQGYLLRDFENRVVQVIPTKQDPLQILDVSFKPALSGKYLYGVCYKAGDHGDRFFTQGGRICRYLLDGSNRDWEEIVSVQKSPKDPFSFHQLDVSSHGDVVMVERGHRLLATLWMYQARTGRVDKLLQVRFPDELGGAQVSPSGRWVIVQKQLQLMLIEQKGVMP